MGGGATGTVRTRLRTEIEQSSKLTRLDETMRDFIAMARFLRKRVMIHDVILL